MRAMASWKSVGRADVVPMAIFLSLVVGRPESDGAKVPSGLQSCLPNKVQILEYEHISLLQKMRSQSAGVKADRSCASGYSGEYVLDINAFRPDAVDEVNRIAGRCEILDESGMIRLQVEGRVVCPVDVVSTLHTLSGVSVTVRSHDAATFFVCDEPHADRTFGLLDETGHLSQTFYEDWRPLQDMLARIEEVVRRSGGVATLQSLSPPTYEHRILKAVRIRGSGYIAGLPRLVLNCQLHAREWITSMVGTYVVEQIVEKAVEEPTWLARTEIVVIPVSNPDGFAYSQGGHRLWRKNRRVNPGTDCVGVDLNRNFAKDWNGSASTSTDPCSNVYVGPSVNSEPETQAIASVLTESPTTVHLDIHSYSQLVIGPWGYTNANHSRKDEADRLGKRMVRAIEASSQHVYLYGTGDVHGALYTASGIAQDYSSAHGALGYTYELWPPDEVGGGFLPPASSILPTAKETLAGIYAAVDWAKQHEGLSPASAPMPTPAPSPPM